MAPPRRCPKQRILDKIERSGGCWLWTGCTTRDGYGVIAIGRGRGSQHRVHRVSYELFKGSIPEGMIVCHSCDTPRCVNPDHLFIGTPKDNTGDMMKKGRKAIVRDLAHPNTKISHDQRAEIRLARENGETLSSIARKYNVSFQTIGLICQRKNCYATA